VGSWGRALVKVKVKVGFLYSATYTKPEQCALTISEVAVDWQEPVVMQRKCGHPLPALMDTGPAVAAIASTPPPQSTTPGLHPVSVRQMSLLQPK